MISYEQYSIMKEKDKEEWNYKFAKPVVCGVISETLKYFFVFGMFSFIAGSIIGFMGFNMGFQTDAMLVWSAMIYLLQYIIVISVILWLSNVAALVYYIHSYKVWLAKKGYDSK